MRRLNIVCYFIAQLRKKLAYNMVPGKSLPVLRFEELFPNCAVGIDEKISGPRHALVLPGRLDVQDVIGVKGFRIRVGEQGKFDFAPVREGFQYLLGVIADGRHSDPLFFKSRFCVLQLDQLRFAVRSPIRRTEKEQNSSLWSFQRLQSLLPAKLVAGRESRSLLTDGQSNRGV